jgi:hypothetical protein
MNYVQRKTATRLKEDTGYKYVYAIINRSGVKCYEAKIRLNGKDTCYYFDTAKEAAKKIDMEFIKTGKPQVNNTLVRVVAKNATV